MIKINLLPLGIINQRRRRDFIIFVSICAVVALGICYFFYFSLNQTVRPLEKELIEIKGKIAQRQPVLKEISKIEKENNELEIYFNTLKGIVVKQSFWPELLYNIYLSLPDTIWLEEIKSDTKGDFVEIRGISLQETIDVAEFIKNMESSKFFSEVKFTKFSQQEMFSKQVMFFQLKCFLSKN